VHRDHDVFMQGIEQEKKLEVTFFNRKRRCEEVGICAPLHYSKGLAGLAKGVEYDLECYYLWDFGAEKGSNFLILSPSQINSMKLTEEIFQTKEFYSVSKEVSKATKEQDING